MGKARGSSRRRTHSDTSNDPRNEGWQPPPLTVNERAYMIRKAKEASVALVDHAHTLDGPVQWHYTGKYRGIQMYRGEGSYDNVGTTGTEFLCGVTTMMGTIEEVAHYFDQQTTEDMVAKKAEDVLDCGVLYSLVYGDPKNLFYRVSAKYQLYEGPSAFSRDRDYCFLECQNTFRHASGRRGWVLSMHSIKLPSCPEVEGVVRGSMYQSGYVFVEAENDGYMDVMHSLQINFKSSSRLPQFMLNSALKQRILSVVTISREIQTSRMGRQTLLRKKDLIPKRARALCANCSRKFSLLVRKTRCRVCGEVVCHSCAPQVTISTARGPAKTRVCIKCYNASPCDEYELDHGDLRRMQNNTRYSDILQNHEHPGLYREQAEDILDEDGGEDGLEEQSDYSVFAQSRFTDVSRDSITASHFNASKYEFDTQFDGSSQFDASSGMDESQYYDGGSSESSFISGVSGTSSSCWEGDNISASSAAWHYANSSDSQASGISSKFDRSKYYGSEDDASHIDHRKQRYDPAPILEDEPSSHRGHNRGPEATYDDYSSTQSTNYNSSQVSDFEASRSFHESNTLKNFKSSQASHSSSSQGSQYSDSSQGSKTVSIQSLAKARSARYGIKNQLPPPPPPPLLSPLEQEDDRSQTHKSDKVKSRNPKGVAARKVFTPPPPGVSRSSHRVSNESRLMAYCAAKPNRDSRSSITSSRDSLRNSTRSSKILEQVRRNRVQTFQFTPDNERSPSIVKSLEQEHLKRMHEIKKLQERANEKAARRFMATSKRGVQSDRGNREVQKFPEQPRLSTRRSRAASRASSVIPPGSPPGTPPSMRNRPLPLPDSSLDTQAKSSLPKNRSQRMAGGSKFDDSHNYSHQPNGKDVQSGTCISFAPSVKGASSAQQSGKQPNTTQVSTYNNARLETSQALSVPKSSHRGNLAFDVSQLSVDKFRFLSSIAMLEKPGESQEYVTMMERQSLQSSLGDSLLNEDVLAQSSGLVDHINSIRARAAYKLPAEENRQSVELQMMQDKHRKRMEELSKLTANHGVINSVRDSTSTLSGLHDSSVSLPDYSKSGVGIKSASPSTSADIDGEDLDFGNRPLGRIKRSGTIAFKLEEMEQGSDMKIDDGEQSKGFDESDVSIRYNKEAVGNENLSYRLSEESAGVEEENMPNDSSSCPIEHEINEKDGPSFCSNKLGKQEYESKTLFSRNINESFQHEAQVDTSAHEDLVHIEYESESELITSSCNASEEHVKRSITPPRCQSDEYVGHKKSFSANCNMSSRRLSEDVQDGHATSSRRSSERLAQDEYEDLRRDAFESFVTSDQARRSENVKPSRRQSGYFVEPESGLADIANLTSVEPAKCESKEKEHSIGLIQPHRFSKEYTKGSTTPPRRQSMELESVNSKYTASPRRLSEGLERILSRRGSEVGVECEPKRNSCPSKGHTNGFNTPPLRQSEKSVEYECELANSAHRYSETLDEYELDFSSQCPTPSRCSSENNLSTPPRRLSEKSIEHDYESNCLSGENESIHPIYRSSEDFIKHKLERESVLSSESEPEDADSVNCSSEEQVAHEASAPKIRNFSSQPILSEDAFLANGYCAFSNSKQLAQVNELEEDLRSPHVSSDVHQNVVDKGQTNAPVFNNSEHFERLDSSRDSNVSSLDEELINRPTIELFDVIHANRAMCSPNGHDPSDTMLKLEASHLRRMEELNQIALAQLGDRISNFDEDMLGSASHLSMRPDIHTEGDEIQWRSSSVMQEVQCKHQVDMEKLRRRIRQLEEECRESIASVLTPEEMDLSEFDSDDDNMQRGRRSLNGRRSYVSQSSFMCASDLSASTISEHASDDGLEQHNPPLPARILFERIAQLTQLQRAMAEAEDDGDDEEHHDRIKEQYRMLRSIQAEGARQERESLSCESLSEENWI